MQKKWLLPCLLAVCLLLTACEPKLEPSTYPDSLGDGPNFTFRTEKPEYSLTYDGDQLEIPLILEISGKEKVVSGANDFQLEQKINGRWYVHVIHTSFYDLAMSYPPDKPIRFSPAVIPRQDTDRLKPGEYRIVKRFNLDDDAAAYFKLVP